MPVSSFSAMMVERAAVLTRIKEDDMKRKGKDDGEKGRGKSRFLLGGLVCLLGLACAAAVFYDGGDGGTPGLSDQETPGVPELSGEVNQDNVMVLLSAYDKDGAHLVGYGTDEGDDWLAYYNEGDRLIDSLNTVVHEECHIFTDVGEEKERIYEGNEKSTEVPYTEVFESKEMVDSVPEQCRGRRFAPYISEAQDGLVSNVEGAYGLLNEFSAYSWGMNNVVAMYPYHERFADDTDTWGSFISNGASNRLAYAEMKYYLLHYLRYAKENYPDIYRQIMENKEFCLAYKDIDSRYAASIAEFEDDLPKIEEKLKQAGHEADHLSDAGEYFRIDSNGLGLMTSEYNTFLEKMAKEPYASIHRKLTE